MSDSNLKGRAHKFGDEINTDYIIAGKYRSQSEDPEELAKHLMEDIDPDFYNRIDENDIIVAGTNFGTGSSREYAATVIKTAGISAIIAKSFARIFFRNCINRGLLVIVADTELIDNKDILQIDLVQGKIDNLSKGTTIAIAPIPKVMRQLLEDGGLAAHFQKHGTFNFK